MTITYHTPKLMEKKS